MPSLFSSLYTTLFSSPFSSPQRRGRRLQRDAVAIIQSDQLKGSTEYMQRIVDHTRDELANFETALTKNQKNRESLVYDLQQRHKNARHRRDYALFSAMTLVLIYIRAKNLQEPGLPAIQTIDDFITSPLEHDADKSNT